MSNVTENCVKSCCWEVNQDNIEKWTLDLTTEKSSFTEGRNRMEQSKEWIGNKEDSAERGGTCQKISTLFRPFLQHQQDEFRSPSPIKKNIQQAKKNTSHNYCSWLFKLMFLRYVSGVWNDRSPCGWWLKREQCVRVDHDIIWELFHLGMMR